MRVVLEIRGDKQKWLSQKISLKKPVLPQCGLVLFFFLLPVVHYNVETVHGSFETSSLVQKMFAEYYIWIMRIQTTFFLALFLLRQELIWLYSASVLLNSALGCASHQPCIRETNIVGMVTNWELSCTDQRPMAASLRAGLIMLNTIRWQHV